MSMRLDTSHLIWSSFSFECHDDAMYFFNDRILRIDETERNLLADIIIEARRCFDCRLDDPYLQNMPLKTPMYLALSR